MSVPRQAAILVGGLGLRLGALTQATPKPLLPVADRPMLEYLIAWLRQWGVREVVLLAGHLGEQLQTLADDAERMGVHIVCRVEAAPAGTGGALAHAADLLAEEFLLLNGDSFFAADLEDLTRTGRADPAVLAALSLRPMEDAGRYGAVTLADERIVLFAEKQPGAGLVNGGVYWLRRSILERIRSLPCSIERDVFPALAAEGALAGRPYDGYFIDIGVPDDFARAQHELPAAVAALAWATGGAAPPSLRRGGHSH